MGRRCAVCHHPENARIDQRLLSGEPVSAIVGEFGFSDAGLRRHLENHVRKPLRATAIRMGAVKHPGAVLAAGGDGLGPVVALGDLVGAMQRNLGRLERAADEAESDKARMVLAALSGQLSRAVEVAAKISGVGAKSDDAGQVTININILGRDPVRVVEHSEER
jgi:hypothetical protein